MSDEPRMLLRDSRLFQGLPDDELDGIAAVATRRTYAREQLIFAQGDPAESLFLLLEGCVRIYQLLDDNELTLAILTPGECFGLIALGDGLTRRRFAQALTAVSCLSIPLTAVLARLGRCPALAVCLLTQLGAFIGRVEDLAASLAFRPVHVRLAQVLLWLQEHAHRDGQLPLHLTHADLATMIATTREQVSLALADFEATGYIVKQHGHVVAVSDVAGLRTMLTASDRDQSLGPPTLLA